MYAHFYAGMRFTALPLLALGLFLGTFVAVIVRVAQSSRRRELDAASRLPLDDNERVTAGGTIRKEGPR